MGFILFIIIGLIAGLIARAVVPGKDDLGILGTLILGAVGSLIGGFLGSLIQDGPADFFTTSGLLGSIIGAIIALLIWRKVGGRSRV